MFGFGKKHEEEEPKPTQDNDAEFGPLISDLETLEYILAHPEEVREEMARAEQERRPWWEKFI